MATPNPAKRSPTLIGVLGGGQLGRMLALAGYPLGLRFRFLDPTPDACAGQVAEHIGGEYSDPAALERFASGASVITYEFENVPLETVRNLARLVSVYPPHGALEVAQDRLTEKTFFNKLGIPTPAFEPVTTQAEAHAALARVGVPAVLKTRRFGYDGKGQSVLRSAGDVEQAWAQMGGEALILEQFVYFSRELSVIAVRGQDGEIACYPLIENHHREGILRLSIAPAPGITGELQATAESYARLVLESLDYVGVLALELFEVRGRLLANEMAPRVHNSGHWTIDGAETGQFENHLRAILGLPLGSTAPRGHSAMLNIIGELPDVERVLSTPCAHLHLYGKEPRPGRKLGHITLSSQDDALVAERVKQLRDQEGKRAAK